MKLNYGQFANLRDAQGKTAATFETKIGGKIEIRDARNVLRGSYDPALDITRDAKGRLVGGGNWLAALIGIIKNA